MDEIHLIEGCKRGERKAQKRLYEKYAGKMMSVCMRYAGNRESAQDLLQEGFIKIFTAIDSYTGSGSFEGWIRRIIVNTALEFLRKTDILRGAIDADDPAVVSEPDYSAVDKISADELMELIASLPTGFRTVFNMYAIEGYSHKEIGEALGIGESTSRSQYTRAKQLLQKKLKEL